MVMAVATGDGRWEIGHKAVYAVKVMPANSSSMASCQGEENIHSGQMWILWCNSVVAELSMNHWNNAVMHGHLVIKAAQSKDPFRFGTPNGLKTGFWYGDKIWDIVGLGVQA